MKKNAILFGCGILLAASLIAGCSSNLDKTAAPTTEAKTEAAAETTAPAAEAPAETAAPAADGELLTGMAVLSSIGSSKDAGDQDGVAQVDSTVVALTLDSQGKIVSCAIDEVRTQIPFTKEGKLAADPATTFDSKSVLGEKYGMKSASKIGKEWSEQAAALAEYVKGKTVDEVKGMAVTADGSASEDLSASVSIKVGGFVKAIEKAAANAQSLGAKPGDKLGLAIATDMEKSADAAADKSGVAQAYSTYTALTVGADGKITSCIIDASQSNVEFDTTGKITSDLTAPLQTKVELKDSYGMKSASKIGLEWYQQAENFAKYAVGKTAEEINGLAVDENEGAPTDADLAASVSIGIGGFKDVISKAAAGAK